MSDSDHVGMEPIASMDLLSSLIMNRETAERERFPITASRMKGHEERTRNLMDQCGSYTTMVFASAVAKDIVREVLDVLKEYVEESWHDDTEFTAQDFGLYLQHREG